MQRARSFSNLPIPVRPGRRSSSVSRSSTKDIIVKSRNPSLDRGRSSVLRTPVSQPRTSRLSSATKTNSASKGKVPISRLVTDKKWVNEQYYKIVEYIEQNPDMFDPQFINANNLKPPSTHTFVYFISVMFNEINPRGKIEIDNYKEKIPLMLKTLKYPGVLTPYTLRLVNTMHAFPHVVALFSWLVQFVSAIKSDPPIDGLNPDDRQKFLKTQGSLRYLINSYLNFNNCHNDPEELARNQEVEDQRFQAEIAEIIGFDSNAYNETLNEVNRLEEYIAKQNEQIAEKTDLCEKLNSEIDYMNEQITNFHREDQKHEKDLDEQLEKLTQREAKLVKQIETVENDVGILKDVIKKQPCTVEEMRAVVEKIENLKRSNALKRDRIEAIQQFKDELDRKLADQIKEIGNLVHKWNKNLIKITVNRPESSKLKLKERGFCNPSFPEEIKEVSETARSLMSKFRSEIEELGGSIEAEKDQIEKVKAVVREKSDANNALALKTAEKKKAIILLEKDTEEMLNEMQQQIESLREKVEFLNKPNRLQELDNTIEKLKSDKLKLKTEFKEFSETGVNFLIDLNKEIMIMLQGLDEIKLEVFQSFKSKYAGLLEECQMQVSHLTKQTI